MKPPPTNQETPLRPTGEGSGIRTRQRPPHRPLPLVLKMILLVSAVVGGGFGLFQGIAVWRAYTLSQATPAAPSKTAADFLKQGLLKNHHQPQAPLPLGATPLSIVLLGIGEDPELAAQALDSLPPEITLALSPLTPDVTTWAQKFHRKGHEIVLAMGMEPEGYPLNDPGPHTLLRHLTRDQMRARLAWALEHVPYAVGVTHDQGSALTADTQAMTWILTDIRDRGGLFLDTLMTPEVVSGEVGQAVKALVLSSERFVENPEVLTKRWSEITKSAHVHGGGVVVLVLSPRMLDRLREVVTQEETSRAFQDQGLVETRVVPLSYLAYQKIAADQAASRPPVPEEKTPQSEASTAIQLPK